MNNPLDSGPRLLLDWHEREDRGRLIQDVLGTIAVHVVLFAVLFVLLSLPAPKLTEVREALDLKKATPLVAPPLRLTQKDLNRGDVAKEIKLENLLPKPEIAQRTPAPPVVARKSFQAPPANPLPPGPKQPALPAPEAPKLDASLRPPQVLPPPVIDVPPPQIEPVEKPKLAFETPGQGGSSQTRGGAMQVKIPIPRPTVDDAIRSIARGGGGQGGIVVGDADQLPSLPDRLRQRPAPARMQSSAELLSDPLGVDFKPYLIRLLAAVKRNWFSVYPESARLGLRGTVALRVVINRSGQVPHLDIAMPSGATALDRAAVASISASIPFSSLPNDFKGDKIVLQLRFQYN